MQLNRLLFRTLVHNKNRIINRAYTTLYEEHIYLHHLISGTRGSERPKCGQRILFRI